MDGTPLIDIIVPIYNGAAYIAGFFEMFSQQYDEKVRLLFVDDGSTDGSGELLEKYAAGCGFPVRILRRPNAGVSAARNAGLEVSDAAYITFFDIDDLASPDYVSVLLSAVRRGDFELFVFPQTRILPKGRIPRTPDAASFYFRTPLEQLKIFLSDPTKLGVYDLLLRRDFVDRAALRFPEGYKYYEDYDFLYRAFAQANQILTTEKAIYYYVLRDGSAMSRFVPDRLSCLSLLRSLEDWFAANAPDFAEIYRRWGIARIYWSVVWQAALAAPTYTDFLQFVRCTHAEVYLRLLRRFPSKRVRLSCAVFRVSRRAFYCVVRKLGGRLSRLAMADKETLEAAAAECPDPRRILLYGMTDNPGGIESYVMGLFRRQPAGTFDFLCDFPKIAYANELKKRVACIHFIPAKSKDLLGHVFGVVRVLRAHPEYATVYFNVLDAGCFFTAAAAWLCGRSIIVHSHNSDTNKVWLHRLCRVPLGFITDGRAACSVTAARYMFGNCSDKALFVPNVIDAMKYRYDPETRKKTRAALGLAERFTVCHVGRVSPQKNSLFLVDVMKEFRGLAPDAVLLHVGDGEMSSEFNAYIREKGMEDAVLRLGVRSDIPVLLQAADAFLLPSLYEGLPIALLEAQAAGLPCVVSDAVTTQAEVTGLVCRVPLSASPEQWAAALLDCTRAERRDTMAEIIGAGFDISCCADHDARLLRLLRGE